MQCKKLILLAGMMMAAMLPSIVVAQQCPDGYECNQDSDCNTLGMQYSCDTSPTTRATLTGEQKLYKGCCKAGKMRMAPVKTAAAAQTGPQCPDGSECNQHSDCLAGYECVKGKYTLTGEQQLYQGCCEKTGKMHMAPVKKAAAAQTGPQCPDGLECAQDSNCPTGYTCVKGQHTLTAEQRTYGGCCVKK